MTPPARSVGKAILGLAILGAGLFVLLEVSARVYLFGIASLDPRKINSVKSLGGTGFTRPSPHPELGYELRPDLDGFFKMVRFRTNSRGLRDRPYELEKPEGTFRVAVLGSSFTLPAGVAIEDAFHTLLEERFSRELSPVVHEFINFSVGAYQPAQLLATLELKALDYDPDLVLFAVTEMAVRVLPRRNTNPRNFYRPGPRTYPFFDSFLVKLWRVRSGSAPPEKTDPRDGRPLQAPLSSSEDAGGKNVIEMLGQVGRRTGIPIVVVRLEFERMEKSQIDTWVEGQTLAQGVYFVDTRAAFKGMDPRDLRVSELDPHPNPLAHEIFAKVLAGFLRRNQLVGR